MVRRSRAILRTAGDAGKWWLQAALMCCGLFDLAQAQVLVPAQRFDDRGRQNIHELRQNDLLLRSEISGQRVDRQVEIARLEGRLDRLEEQIRALPNQAGTSQFALVLSMLNTPQLEQAAVDAHPELPSPNEPDASGISNRQRQLLQLVAQDYSLALEIETVEARVSLLEATAELNSLERLAAKGLASSGQLKFQALQHQRAELQLRRTEQQLAGLRQLYPQFFGEELPSGASLESADKDAVLPAPDDGSAAESDTVDSQIAR